MEPGVAAFWRLSVTSMGRTEGMTGAAGGRVSVETGVLGGAGDGVSFQSTLASEG